jgi:osmotically-inducible protein OsmY
MVYDPQCRLRWLFLMLIVVALNSCVNLFGDSEGIKEKPQADVMMAMKVKAALIDTSQLSAAAIEVAVSHGQVRLSGFAETAAQRQLAGDVASRVSGVKNVINDIEVK